jgi:hypothetical protein
MIIKFQKIQGLWYAILPEYIEAGGDFNDCLMVENTPEMLDLLSNNTEEIEVIIDNKLIINADLVLELENQEFGWAYYTPMENDFGFYPEHVGLCPVNLFVWGGSHPETIWIKRKQ